LPSSSWTAGDLKIRLKFNAAGGSAAGIGGSGAACLAGAREAGGCRRRPRLRHSSPKAAAATAPPADPNAGLHMVKSPIVGTFYGSPSPGASPFVLPGDHVDKGQVICIVEAMKLMNEIESDAAGEIVKCLVSNGQPIEFGQPLFSIRLARLAVLGSALAICTPIECFVR
jgi:acetyl-CoA carboxylase biotin carboxyl carrier protein